MEKYHPYVFDTETQKFVGQFEEMYQNELKEGFDSWHQDDLRPIDLKICLDILSQYNFAKILDVGCGKGAFTQHLKKVNNHVMALDLSKTAIQRATVRYPDIVFCQADVAKPEWTRIVGGGFDLIVCLEVLSYIKEWPRLIQDFARLGVYILIKLFIPDNPIGYVKSMDELTREFSKSMSIIEDIRLINRRHIILFGRSFVFEK